MKRHKVIIPSKPKAEIIIETYPRWMSTLLFDLMPAVLLSALVTLLSVLFGLTPVVLVLALAALLYCMHSRQKALKELAQQKYRRCLNLAKYSRAEINYADSIGYSGAIKFYARLERKYLALANKFKGNCE